VSRIALFAMCGMLAMLPACSQAQPVRQSDLDAISDKCHRDRTGLRLHDKGEVIVERTAGDSVDATLCVFNEIKNAKFSDMKLKTVGQETFMQKAR